MQDSDIEINEEGTKKSACYASFFAKPIKETSRNEDEITDLLSSISDNFKKLSDDTIGWAMGHYGDFISRIFDVMSLMDDGNNAFTHFIDDVAEKLKNIGDTPKKYKNADEIACLLSSISDDIEKLSNAKIVWTSFQYGDFFSKIFEAMSLAMFMLHATTSPFFKREEFRKIEPQLSAIDIWAHRCTTSKKNIIHAMSTKIPTPTNTTSEPSNTSSDRDSYQFSF
jgi:hypothetical protein